jgi:hypothetical protein
MTTTIDMPVQTKITTIQGMFSFSPFGLCCHLCPKNVSIKLNKRCIGDHVKKHGLDSRAASIHSLYNTFITKLKEVKAAGSIEPHRVDKKRTKGFLAFVVKFF